MADTFFKGIFDTDMTSVITVSDFLLCVGRNIRRVLWQLWRFFRQLSVL